MSRWLGGKRSLGFFVDAVEWRKCLLRAEDRESLGVVIRYGKLRKMVEK